MGRSQLSEMRSFEKQNVRLKKTAAELELDDPILKGSVRGQGFCARCWPELREDLAHLFGLIMRRICDEASAAFRWSFV